MTIAQKSGSLIIKEGKVASNCNCCEGWYCCQPQWRCGDWTSRISIEVNIQASDFVRFTSWQSDPNIDSLPQRHFLVTNMLAVGTLFNGSHTLSLESVSGRFATFSKNLKGWPSNCAGGRISAQVSSNLRDFFDPAVAPSDANNLWSVDNVTARAYWLQNEIRGCGPIPGSSEPKTYEYITSKINGTENCQSAKPEVYCDGHNLGEEEINFSSLDFTGPSLGNPYYVPSCTASHTETIQRTQTLPDYSQSTPNRFFPPGTTSVTGSLTVSSTYTIKYDRGG